MPSLLIKARSGLLVLSLLLPCVLLANTLNESIETQVTTDKAAQASQEKIDEMADNTQDLQSEYRQILNQTQRLQVYNKQLSQLVDSQQSELDSIHAQLSNIDTTQRDIVPLMMKMVDVLDQFVTLDLPFLPEERANRLTSLQTMMTRADVSLTEKYRRIMEAYQVEMEYGRTIEAYQGTLVQQDNSRTVDFVRIGRLGLYYLTLDGAEAGAWDQQMQQWQPLNDDQIQHVVNAVKVARKELPPDLLILPLPTKGEAS